MYKPYKGSKSNLFTPQPNENPTDEEWIEEWEKFKEENKNTDKAYLMRAFRMENTIIEEKQ